MDFLILIGPIFRIQMHGGYISQFLQNISILLKTIFWKENTILIALFFVPIKIKINISHIIFRVIETF